MFPEMHAVVAREHHERFREPICRYGLDDLPDHVVDGRKLAKATPHVVGEDLVIFRRDRVQCLDPAGLVGHVHFVDELPIEVAVQVREIDVRV